MQGLWVAPEFTGCRMSSCHRLVTPGDSPCSGFHHRSTGDVTFMLEYCPVIPEKLKKGLGSLMQRRVRTRT